jgi:hypothetical protein
MSCNRAHELKEHIRAAYDGGAQRLVPWDLGGSGSGGGSADRYVTRGLRKLALSLVGLGHELVLLHHHRPPHFARCSCHQAERRQHLLISLLVPAPSHSQPLAYQRQQIQVVQQCAG